MMHQFGTSAPTALLAWLGLGLIWPGGPLLPAPRAAGQGVSVSVSEGRREPIFDGLGSYTRRVTTTSEAAQRYFDQGLNLLFAFNHDEAGRSFRQAAALDPSCAMAW